MPDDPFDRFRTNVFGNAPGPRDWSPPVDPLAGAGSGRPARRLRAWRNCLIAGVVALLVGGFALVGLSALQRHLHPASGDGPALANGTVIGTGDGTTAPPDAVDLTAATPVGTCLTAAAPTTVEFVPCTSPHRYELVGHERASGAAFPGADYWNGPIARRCYADELGYTALPRDSWPAGLDSSSFIPRADGWAAGDRNVYCVAQWSTDVTTSARGLKAGPPPSVVPPSFGPPPVVPPTGVADTVLAGRLTRIDDPQGSPGCLGIATGDGTFVVESATDAYSWTVTLDAGVTVDAVSGIVRGDDPAGRDFLAHTGDTVQLTGTWSEYTSGGPCGAGAAFGFTAVG